MKKLIILSFVLMNLLGCNKDKTPSELKYSNNILAGEMEGIGISYSGEISDTLFFYYPSSNTNRYIDINDDGINDFELRFEGSGSPGHRSSKNSILPIGNSFLATPTMENSVVDTLSLNETIDNGLNWVNDTCVLYNYYKTLNDPPIIMGLWGAENKYIGTKIFVNDKELFGWIRVEFTDDWGWSPALIDYACTVGYD